MENLFCKTFRFKATRYEEWQIGQCISSGLCDTTIEMLGASETTYMPLLCFKLKNIAKVKIDTEFSFLLYSATALGDRIQLVAPSDFNPNTPCVCHLFFEYDELTCVRFAMTNPDRIVEYYGELEQL